MDAINAQQQAFSTTELLEQILWYLPPRTLLLSKSVCHRFQDVISNSLELRQKLHLEPDLQASQPKLSPIRFEPNFCHILYAISVGHIFVYGEVEVWKSTPACDGSVESWRDMFPCQPPPTGILLSVPGRILKRPMLRVAPGCRGVTLGMIVDALWKFGSPGLWEEGRKGKFYALSETEIPCFMAKFDCEEVMVETRIQTDS